MKKLILWALTLTLLMFSSCGNDELATIPNIKDNPVSESVESEQDIFAIPESAIVVNYVPSYVTEALNNAKILFEELGDINETKTDNIHYYVTDNKGNIYVIDTNGNLDIQTHTKDIHIDSSVRESTTTPIDAIHNTIWKGLGKESVNFFNPTGGGEPIDKSFYTEHDSTYWFYYAKFEETSFYGNISSNDFPDIASKRELKFNNSTCILTTWDTIKIYRKTVAPKYRKIKVKEQKYTRNGDSYKIEIKDNTLYVYCTYSNELQTKLIDTEQLDSDSTFIPHWDLTFETINIDVVKTITYHKCIVYNYKTNEKGEIRLYDNKTIHEPYHFKNGEMFFTSCIYNNSIGINYSKVKE